MRYRKSALNNLFQEYEIAIWHVRKSMNAAKEKIKMRILGFEVKDHERYMNGSESNGGSSQIAAGISN
jgi:hypothetical protein